MSLEDSSGGWRGWLNRNPTVLMAVAVVGVLLALFLMRNSFRTELHGSMFFTNDDGQTYFTGPPRAAPYKSGGKEVYQALVYVCDGKRFVGYLRRFPESIRAEVDARISKPNAGMVPLGELKKPGETEWTKQTEAFPQVLCPNGKPAISHLTD